MRELENGMLEVDTENGVITLDPESGTYQIKKGGQPVALPAKEAEEILHAEMSDEEWRRWEELRNRHRKL